MITTSTGLLDSYFVLRKNRMNETIDGYCEHKTTGNCRDCLALLAKYRKALQEIDSFVFAERSANEGTAWALGAAYKAQVIAQAALKNT